MHIEPVFSPDGKFKDNSVFVVAMSENSTKLTAKLPTVAAQQQRIEEETAHDLETSNDVKTYTTLRDKHGACRRN